MTSSGLQFEVGTDQQWH